MLGIVRTHLTQMVTWLKARWSAMILKMKSLFPNTGASVIDQMIQFVQHIYNHLRAAIKLSIKQFPVLSLTLLAWLINLVIILALLTAGLLGLLLLAIVNLCQRLVLKLQNKGQYHA